VVCWLGTEESLTFYYSVQHIRTVYSNIRYMPHIFCYKFELFPECLSRQSSLVINIVGTDDIGWLPSLATGLTDDGLGGGVSCVHSSVCFLQFPPTRPRY
jgi:hypothetical protein